MSLSDRPRMISRVDVRIALITGAAVGVLVSLVLFLLWMRAGYEALEQIERESAGEARSMAASLTSAGEMPEPARLAPIARHTEIEGYVVYIKGPRGEAFRSALWPRGPSRWGGSLHPISPLLAFEQHWIVRSFDFPNGLVIRIGAPLADYRREQAEMARQLAWSILFGWLGAAVVALIVTRQAMQPIVAATTAIEAVNEAHLSARLQTRGTRDPLDQHVSALNRVLGRLEWAFERMRAFSADAAHELRTPVNRVLNVAEVALLPARSDADRIAAIERIQATAQEMQRLVGSLLLLERGEDGRLPLLREPRDLRSLLENLLDLYEPLALERGIKLALFGPSAIAEVDANLFERVLANLLENALRFAPTGSAIRTEIVAEREFVRLAIEDEGPGIPKEERSRVFERFVRLDAPGSGSGSGLGLPIARMIVALHGGELWIEDGISSGARLVIRIPALPPAA